MQQKIHLLSDETINQIAAGEVIESPASVVKELVENAIDAKATKVTIEITGGGLKLIKITDDGTGMSPEDARVCIVRHATSKIQKATDLFSIITSGFRGEALASIASIAKMTLTTALQNETGIEFEIEHGKVISEKPVARKPGTTIQVRSLFYNVPARKKFQKNAAALSAEIFRTVTILALGHPNLHFELISNGRKSIKTGSLGLKERAEELLGEEFTRGSFSVSFEEGPFKFIGLIGAPTNHRPSRMNQYLYLNKRGVVCDPVTDAVRAGYGTRIEERRHPIFFLHLDMPPDLVDVNVHPQKLQVRLRKEELIKEKVQQAVFGALSVSVSAGAFAFTPTHSAFKPEPISFRFEEEKEVERPLFASPAEEFLGQVGTYLFFKREQKLTLLDTEKASFRIRYEQMVDQERGASQGLLVPFTLTFTSVESAMLLTHLAAIEDLGFSLRPIGKDAFMVEALPPYLDEQMAGGVLHEMAEDLKSFIGKKDYALERKQKLALRAASKWKGKKQYTESEAFVLLGSLRATNSPLHCPKGNTTMVELEDEQIQELFRANQTTTIGS